MALEDLLRENTLAVKICGGHLERIAAALEGLLAEHGYVPDSPTTVKPKAPPAADDDDDLDAADALGDDDLDDDLDDDDDEPPAKKKVAKKKTSKKKASKKTVGKKSEKTETTLTIKDDVRPAAKRLRDGVSSAAVKSLLKKFNASTLAQLNEKHFQAFIDAVNAELGEEEESEEDDL